MNQDQIRRCLTKLRYEGGYSLRALSKLIGIAPQTIEAAMIAQVSEEKQRRLSQFLPMIPRNAPHTKKPKKGKPGHFKRYLIRYYNLRGWLTVIEAEPGIAKKFSRVPHSNMSREMAAYVCARYDFQMKHHLLALFGEVLKQKKIVMGDCYSCEKWIERIHKVLPGARQALFKKLLTRQTKTQPAS